MSLWYDSTLDQTPVSRAIGQHSTQYILNIYDLQTHIYIYCECVYVSMFVHVCMCEYIHIKMYIQIISIYNSLHRKNIHLYARYIHCTQYISLSIYIYIYIYHHHHDDVRLARISLTLSLHVSLSFIAFGRSSGLHPVSSHSCCMNVRAGRPAFDWPYAGVHRSISLTSSSLLLQQCPACLVRLACIVFVIGGRWPYSWRRVGCCCQDTLGLMWACLCNT